MWRSAWFMRVARAKNAGTSDVYIGRRRRERGTTDGNERKRKGRESAYAQRESGGRRAEEHLRVCAGSAQLAVTNGRDGRRTEKVSVARFARVHLTKKSNIYFAARTTKHFWNVFLRLCRCRYEGRRMR